MITQKFLRDNKIKTLEELRAKLPELDTKDAATAPWIDRWASDRDHPGAVDHPAATESGIELEGVSKSFGSTRACVT